MAPWVRRTEGSQSILGMCCRARYVGAERRIRWGPTGAGRRPGSASRRAASSPSCGGREVLYTCHCRGKTRLVAPSIPPNQAPLWRHPFPPTGAAPLSLTREKPAFGAHFSFISRGSDETSERRARQGSRAASAACRSALHTAETSATGMRENPALDTRLSLIVCGSDKTSEYGAIEAPTRAGAAMQTRLSSSGCRPESSVRSTAVIPPRSSGDPSPSSSRTSSPPINRRDLCLIAESATVGG